jgi:hypothetical protein
MAETKQLSSLSGYSMRMRYRSSWTDRRRRSDDLKCHLIYRRYSMIPVGPDL